MKYLSGDIFIVAEPFRSAYMTGLATGDTLEVVTFDAPINQIIMILNNQYEITCFESDVDEHCIRRTASQPSSKPSAHSPPLSAPGFPINRGDTMTHQKLKCECGVDSIGGGMHSTWCPIKN